MVLFQQWFLFTVLGIVIGTNPIKATSHSAALIYFLGELIVSDFGRQVDHPCGQEWLHLSDEYHLITAKPL